MKSEKQRRRRLNVSLLLFAAFCPIAPVLIAREGGFTWGSASALVLALGLSGWMSRALTSRLSETMAELRETQAQLVLNERLAGLGLLVAAVAHEINSPSAAIHGTAHNLVEAVPRFTRSAQAVAALPMKEDSRRRFYEECGRLARVLSAVPLLSPADARRRVRELTAELVTRGLETGRAAQVAGTLVDMSATPEATEILHEVAGACERPAADALPVLVEYLRECAYVHRATGTIANANDRIQSVVRDLKSYSHLDEAAGAEVDLNEGIEHTLVLFDHMISPGVKVKRRFGRLPKLFVYVDQLNQVWTNLIHNALQAMDGQGNLSIETAEEAGGVAVRVIDDGPGISREAMPHIFEPFYTTKARGEGSGLGLKIAQQIVERHSGRVRVESQPGRTCFEVWLPLPAEVTQ